MQLTLLSYIAVSFIISVGQSNWLDDEWSPLIYYLDNQSNWFDGEGLPSVCHQSIQRSWLDDKGLTDAHF